VVTPWLKGRRYLKFREEDCVIVVRFIIVPLEACSVDENCPCGWDRFVVIDYESEIGHCFMPAIRGDLEML
jgi:hypothetical protein